MPESLIYVETGGRIQCLNKLSEDQKAAVLAGAAERIHELTPDGATTEDEATGKVRRDGKPDDNDHGGRLAALRAKHPPKPPKDPKTPKATGKGGK